MQLIEDKDLALQLRSKIMEFNQRGLVLPALLTVAYVALPEIAGLILH